VPSLPRYRPYVDPRSYIAVGHEVVTGRWRQGGACVELEKSLASLGAPHAVLAPRGRVALHLAVKASIRPGQKVVLSPYTLADAVRMVVAAGGVPLFADIERETCNIDPGEIEKLVDGDSGAVLVTHLHGLACDMDVIPRICTERGVKLIEDAAQAFGGRFAGRPVGSFGDAGVFSFGRHENVNAFLGGVLLTRHSELAQRARAELAEWRLQDARHYLEAVLDGLVRDVASWPPLFRAVTFRVLRFAFLHDLSLPGARRASGDAAEPHRDLPERYRRRMTPLQARLILRQLARVDEHTRERIERARAYHQGLRDVPELRLPPLRTDFSHTYTSFPIQVDDRIALLRHLMRSGRDVAGQQLANCADLPTFREWHRDCPNARKTAASVVLLPAYPRYSMSDVEANVRAIREYFGAGAARRDGGSRSARADASGGVGEGVR
jgi:dTDP-4-amino-4,6-dideoxygalactose transaminase